MRDRMFLNSDAASKAEEVAYPLATDYGLDDIEAEELAGAVEKAIFDFFAARSALSPESRTGER